MSSVTRRIKETKQPRGGYISPNAFVVRQLEGGIPGPLDHKVENMHAPLVGSAVDYLARLANGAEPRDAFRVSLMGAGLLGASAHMRAMADVALLVPGRVDVAAIAAACRLVAYDVARRAGPGMYNPDAQTSPDAVTAEHIAVMVDRSVAFLSEYGPVALDGFTFAGGYTDTVDSGDGDFLTADTVWDFKVSVSGPTKNHTLQLLMYYLMGRRSGQPQFDEITHLGVFNPRLNIVYRVALADVPAGVITEVSRDVIGYQ
jgi:hypothetical protein